MEHIKKVQYTILVFCTTIASIYCNTKKESTSKKNITLSQDGNKATLQSSHLKAQSNQKSIPRTIRLTSNITNKMLKYRWGWSEHEPTSFYLKVKDIVINNGEEKHVEVKDDNTVEVTYHYDFKNGLVTGSKTIVLHIPPSELHVNLSFSWKDDLRIIPSVGRSIRSKDGILESAYSLS